MESGQGVAGCCDGVKGGQIYGWAWFPAFPDLTVDIELLVDGTLVATVPASDYRPDLRAAGVGHGRYGWRLPQPVGVTAASRITVRVKDGETLPNGDFSIADDDADETLDNDELTAFVAAVLGRGPKHDRSEPAAATPVHFLLHAPVLAEASTLGVPEYSYGFVLRAFEPMLRQLGQVHVLTDVEAEADRLYLDHIARGETSILLSFAPPHRTVLGLRCPVVPVIAWEFPTIPARIWSDDRRHDWRFVLRQTGRAITLSSFAAQAVKATMGADFPVASLPAPSWDRFSALQATPARPVDASATLAIDGFVFDTGGRVFESGTATPAIPHRRGDAETERGEALDDEVVLDGIVFSAVFSPKDGRKNWADMVTAFLAAHRDRPDATLVLKMIGKDVSLWWWEFNDILRRQLPFACRIVVLDGYLADEAFDRLILASHWIVCASRAEGLCLPLVEFMSAGRPAISPRHTAMLDYVTPENALIVESDEEYCGFPHDPANEMTTTRHRVSWPGLMAAFAEGYAVATGDPARYQAMARAAHEVLRDFCSEAVVARGLDRFLGLNLALGDAAATPSALIGAVAA